MEERLKNLEMGIVIRKQKGGEKKWKNGI